MKKAVALNIRTHEFMINNTNQSYTLPFAVFDNRKLTIFNNEKSSNITPTLNFNGNILTNVPVGLYRAIYEMDNEINEESQYSVKPLYSPTSLTQVLTSNEVANLDHSVASDKDKASILVYETTSTKYLWLGKHYWIDIEDNKIYFDPTKVANNISITIKYLRLIPDEPSNR